MTVETSYLTDPSLVRDPESARRVVDGLIQEYMLSGLQDERILELFRRSGDELLRAVMKLWGEEHVKRAIRRARRAWSMN